LLFSRSIHDESDSNDHTSSTDTNVSSIPEELNTDINESHDNNESLGGIADGGLASFVKSSTMDDDYCKFLDKINLKKKYVSYLDHPNKESKKKREHSSPDKKSLSSKSIMVYFLLK
jgi:hypothetical protein